MQIIIHLVNLTNIVTVVTAGVILGMVGYFIKHYSDMNHLKSQGEFLKLQVSKQLPTQIKDLDTKLSNRIEKLDTKMNNNHNQINKKIDRLDDKIDNNHNEIKDLVIKSLSKIK